VSTTRVYSTRQYRDLEISISRSRIKRGLQEYQTSVDDPCLLYSAISRSRDLNIEISNQAALTLMQEYQTSVDDPCLLYSDERGATPILTLPPCTRVAKTGSLVACVLEKSPDKSVPSDSTTSPLGSL